MNIGGNGGELRMVVQIKRKTGETETHELVGKVTEEQAEQLGLKGEKDGDNALDNGA